MGREKERVMACARAVREKTGLVPETAVVLGSGLGAFGERVERPVVLPTADLPGFPASTVAGHRGRLILGELAGAPVVVAQGRVHYYEGYPMADVVLPIRLFWALGARRVILTNAAGGIREDLRSGGLMLLTDHIASFAPSPLAGPNEEEFGPRFPDMTEVYSQRLRALAQEAASETGVPLGEGVYLQTPGPAYETPAEVRLYAALGADAVGMSTACEAVAARHLGMEVCGISCVTNAAAGLGGGPLDHQEVQAAADRLGEDFQRLLLRLLEKLAGGGAESKEGGK